MNTKKDSLYRKITQTGSTLALGTALLLGVSIVPAQAQYGSRSHRDDSRYRNSRYDHDRYDRRDDWRSSRSLLQQAQQYGFNDGYQRGQYDRQNGTRRPNPQGHGAYQFGLNGWERDRGSSYAYRQSYRQAFLEGYWRAFGRG
jgi:hypothetical protein